METAIYRSNPAYCRLESSVQIVDSFLLPLSRGGDRVYTEDSIVRVVADRSETVEWQQFISAPVEGVEPKVDTNAICVSGRVVSDIIDLLQSNGALDHTRSRGAFAEITSSDPEPVSRTNDRSKKKKLKEKNVCTYEPPVDLFDELDAIVFEYLKDRYFDAFQASPVYIKYHGFMCLAETSLTEEDFSLFRVLGRGGFGLVNGCKKCTSGKLFAMKVMDKRRIKMKKSETLCVNERNILAMVDSPFIVNLKYAFSTKTELFLILDLMTGGDLGFLLHRLGKLEIVHARFVRNLYQLYQIPQRFLCSDSLRPVRYSALLPCMSAVSFIAI